MARKTARAERGQRDEPSVVQSARARAIGRVPNAWLGLVYYAGLALAVPFIGVPLVWAGALVAGLLAASLSLYLAYSLLFVTRMPCVYCWTGHAVNWSLLLLLVLLQPAKL